MWFLIIYLCLSKKYLGFDSRQIKEPVTMEKIYELNHNKDVLDFLQSKYISTADKLERIKNSTHSTFNHIMNGGLTKDWDFDIENNLYHS